MRSPLPLLALAGVAALTLAGCTSGGGGTGGSSGGTGADGELADGGTFTVSISSDPGTLDPTKTSLSVARSIDRFLYSRLVESQPDGSIQSGLAEKWEGDTTNAVFTLREGLTCEDGTEITATDVAANLQFIGDPANASPMIGLQVQPGTTAVGDDAARTVTVTSGAPDSFLIENLGSVGIVCGPALEDPDVLAKGGGATGMFKMGDIVANSQYTLTRRDEFTWGPDDFDPKAAGIPDEVVFRVVANETTAANLLTTKEVQAAAIVGPESTRLLQSGLKRSELEAPIGQMYFNQNEGRITADLGVREALAQSLDFTQLLQVITNGEGTAPKSMVTVAPNPCQGDNVEGNVPAFDADKAASGLDAAGWKPGSDGVRTKDGKPLALTLMYATTLGDSATAAAELVQKTWTDLGVKVTMKGVDSPGLSEALFGTGDWDVSLAPITVNLPSMLVPFFSGPTPPAGMNFAGLNVEGYVDGVKAASAQAGTAGCDDWNAAEVALIKSVSVVPYANVIRGTFANGATFAEDDGIVPTSIRLFK